jgi:hypothetical protein
VNLVTNVGTFGLMNMDVTERMITLTLIMVNP